MIIDANLIIILQHDIHVNLDMICSKWQSFYKEAK